MSKLFGDTGPLPIGPVGPGLGPEVSGLEPSPLPESSGHGPTDLPESPSIPMPAKDWITDIAPELQADALPVPADNRQ